MNKIKLIVLIAIISVLITGCVQVPKQDIDTSTTVAPTLTPTTTPTSTAKPVIYYVGETASDGVVNITLNGLRYTSVINEKNLVKAQPGNMFIILDITLEIIKNGEKRFYPQGGPFRIRDSNGYVYTTNQQEHEALRQGLTSAQNLTYGDKVRGELAFEIPENNNGLTFQFLFDPDNRVTFKLGDTPVPTTINYAPVTTPTPIPILSAPIILSGKGQRATDLFFLPEGLVRFEMTHDGDSNFAIKLLDDQGRYQALLVNEIGTFEGSKAERIDKAGMYLLDITANGNWKITIR